MKATSRLMFLILLATVSTGLAWSGGPWSGNTADNTAGKGTYSGTMRGKNLLGVFTFQYSPDRIVNTLLFDSFIVSHEGFSISGSTAAIVDTEGRRVTGVMTSSSSQNTANTSNASGSFDAKMTSTKPQIKFAGDGEFSSDANSTVTTSSTSETSVPSGTVTTTSGTQIRRSTKIKVAGVRSSLSTGTSTTTQTGTTN